MSSIWKLPSSSCPRTIQDVILNGSGKEKITFAYLNENGTRSHRKHTFEGIIPNLERRYKETESVAVREELAKYLNSQMCPECAGTRLRREARNVRVGGQAIYEINALPLKEAKAFFEQVELTGHKLAIAEKIVKEISSRISFLNNVGLDYLSLERSADTLSGGESQRIRLASQIGSGLTGVMYVLDEPSIGLHQRDNEPPAGNAQKPARFGNSVIVVEHDQDAILAADHVVDMGPGAGEHGGAIIAQGTPEDIQQNPDSLTGKYLSGKLAIALPEKRTEPKNDRWLKIEPAHRGNNLKNVNLNLPVGLFVCVTGVSGSGKSTLINETLYQAMAQPSLRQHRGARAVSEHRWAGLLRQGHQHGPESHRTHAALQPSHLYRTVHADPRVVRGRAPGARARLWARAILVQRQGRPLRSLPGRRHDQG